MKCILTFIWLLFFAPALTVKAQKTESFDLATYPLLTGWKKESRDNLITYTATDNANGGYCVIAIYRNIEGSGSVNTDFANDWQQLVAERYTVKGTPEASEGKRPDGWFSKAGAASIHDGRSDAMAILSTFSLSGRKLSILVLLNNDQFYGKAENFLTNLRLKKPPSTQPLPPQPKKKPVTNSGISIATTNFDDGWVSTVEKDWVCVKKGGAAVFLYYYFNVGPEMRPPNGNIRDNLWNRIVKQRFTVLSENESRKTMINEWKEGEAIDKETGQKVYLAMSWNGGFYLAVTPDKQSSVSLFPTPDHLNDMSRYNKFAIAAKDIFGTWQNGGSLTTEWYNEVSGLYTGATLAATSAVFSFAANGSYNSIHNGATGAVVGGMNNFQQQYKGQYTVSNWQLTATNRYQGKTGVFDAHFQAVRGGRLLYLNNDRGEQYLLVRTKN